MQQAQSLVLIWAVGRGHFLGLWRQIGEGCGKYLTNVLGKGHDKPIASRILLSRNILDLTLTFSSGAIS
jgi:hypothetical protein